MSFYLNRSFTVRCLFGITLVTALLSPALADSSTIGGPVLGLVFDPVTGLRAIQGIPGASVLSKPLDTGLAIRQASISPRQNYAVVEAGDNLDVSIVQISEGVASVAPLAGADPGPDLISLSPGGSAVALYYAGARKVQVLNGLPSSPALTAEFDISSLPSTVSAVAISDDAGVVLIAFAEETAAPVFLLASGNDPQFLSVLGHVSAIAFQSGNRSALIADDRENQIYLLSNVSAPAGWNIVATAGDGISGPVAVSVSRDNRRGYVANQGNSSVTVLDLSGGSAAPASAACSCTPAGLFPLNGNAVFRLVEDVSQPIWMFDGDAGAPRIVFVPAAPDEPGSGRRSRR